MCAQAVIPLCEISVAVYRAEQLDGGDLPLDTKLHEDGGDTLVIEETDVEREVV